MHKKSELRFFLSFECIFSIFLGNHKKKVKKSWCFSILGRIWIRFSTKRIRNTGYLNIENLDNPLFTRSEGHINRFFLQGAYQFVVLEQKSCLGRWSLCGDLDLGSFPLSLLPHTLHLTFRTLWIKWANFQSLSKLCFIFFLTVYNSISALKSTRFF